MSELMVRLRQTAHVEYSEMDRVATPEELMLRFFLALQPLLVQVRDHKEYETAHLREPLYVFAVICAVAGVDVVELLQADVARREFTRMKAEPGKAAPIPGEDGVLRDPVTGSPSKFT